MEKFHPDEVELGQNDALVDEESKQIEADSNNHMLIERAREAGVNTESLALYEDLAKKSREESLDPNGPTYIMGTKKRLEEHGLNPNDVIEEFRQSNSFNTRVINLRDAIDTAELSDLSLAEKIGVVAHAFDLEARHYNDLISNSAGNPKAEANKATWHENLRVNREKADLLRKPFSESGILNKDNIN